MTWQCVKKKKWTRRSRVAWLLFFIRCNVLWCYYSTRARKNVIYLFYTIKIHLLGTRERKTNLLKWSDVDLTPSVCVCPWIDHGQQPMKMHREVSLLYNHHHLQIGCTKIDKFMYLGHILILRSRNVNGPYPVVVRCVWLFITHDDFRCHPGGEKK